MLYTGIYIIDLFLFYLSGALVVYLMVKSHIKNAPPAERFGYWFFVFGSWATLCLFVVVYLLGFAIGFFKELRTKI